MAFHHLSEQFGLIRHPNQQPIVFHGQANGYYTVVEFEEYAGKKFYTIKIGVNLDEDEWKSDRFTALLEEINRTIKPEALEYRQNVFYLGATSPLSFEEQEPYVAEILNFVTERLQSFGLKTGDFFNGHEDDTIDLYVIADSYFLLSTRSYEERKKQNDQENPPTGMGSAVKGALIGAGISLIPCAVFYSFSDLFVYRNFGWLMGFLISVFAFIFHRKNDGTVSKDSVLKVFGRILGILFLSITVVLLFDLTMRGDSLLAMVQQLFLSVDNFSLVYGDLFSELLLHLVSFWIVGAIFAAVIAFFYYRVYARLSQAAREIEKA